MAALASTDVTVTITQRWREGKKRKTRGTIAFGDGALTYSTAGVPLPAIGSFGMQRQLDSLHVFGVNERTTDYMLRYGPADHTLLMYEEEAAAAGGPLLECDVAEAPAARTYSFEASGW